MGSMVKVAVLVVAMMAGLNLEGCKHRPPLSATEGGSTGVVCWGDASGGVDLPKFVDFLGNKSGLVTIYFDFDSVVISPDAMATLKSNAEMIKRVPKIVVQIAGHCDNRGTQEYNLALGERRALAVRTFLIQCGVPSDRLATISYGAEYPAVLGNNESAWSKNRRVEFNASEKRN